MKKKYQPRRHEVREARNRSDRQPAADRVMVDRPHQTYPRPWPAERTESHKSATVPASYAVIDNLFSAAAQCQAKGSGRVQEQGMSASLFRNEVTAARRGDWPGSIPLQPPRRGWISFEMRPPAIAAVSAGQPLSGISGEQDRARLADKRAAMANRPHSGVNAGRPIRISNKSSKPIESSDHAKSADEWKL